MRHVAEVGAPLRQTLAPSFSRAILLFSSVFCLCQLYGYRVLSDLEKAIFPPHRLFLLPFLADPSCDKRAPPSPSLGTVSHALPLYPLGLACAGQRVTPLTGNSLPQLPRPNCLLELLPPLRLHFTLSLFVVFP